MLVVINKGKMVLESIKDFTIPKEVRIMDYEKELEKEKNKNEKYLKEFESWLKKQKLSTKTIKNHISNADLYINDYLNYYEITPMENGISMLSSFFDDWFIRKCMWSTGYATKTTATSLKKFYNCMAELGYIKQEDYKFVCDEMKENLSDWIEEVEDYNNFDEDDIDFF